jgi:flagellar basal body-associated protein FliL
MKGSRVASRIVIFVVLVVVFGIGVSFIILPSMQGAQSQAANNPSAAATPRAASDLPVPDTSAAAREAAATPVTPPGAASPAAPAPDTQLASASGDATKAPAPKRE